MKLLEERILADGDIRPGGVLKVDSFLNHQMDVDLILEMGREFYRLYGDCGVNKILTIEASGIAIACAAAQFFHVPVVFAKKKAARNVGDDVYRTQVVSFTHGGTNDVIVSRSYLGPEDRLLIVDDFLASGAALVGLRDIARQAGAEVVGAGIAVEKVFQGGGEKLRAEGMRIESLARVAEMDDAGHIRFA